jgi:hypothetical protein
MENSKESHENLTIVKEETPKIEEKNTISEGFSLVFSKI